MVAVTGSRDPSKRGVEMAGPSPTGLPARGMSSSPVLRRGSTPPPIAPPLPNADTGAGGAVAVLPGGIDNMYPPETADLRARIAGAGLPPPRRRGASRSATG